MKKLEKRVKVPLSLLKTILRKYKQNKGLSWKEISLQLNVSISTIRDWIIKQNTIPINIFRELLNGSGIKFKTVGRKIKLLETFWGQKVYRSKFEGVITLPKIKNNSKFAEFYGILLGDGCVYSNLSGFCISGNSNLDKVYLENYVSKLIYDLFNIYPHIYYSKSEKSIRAVCYSQTIAKFLVKIGFPPGKKNNGNPRIPNSFFNNPDCLRRCLRGINDTDGSIYPQRNSKIILDISIPCKSLRESSNDAFKRIGIGVNSTNNRIYICGKKNVSKVIQSIGISNLKNKVKYQSFLKYHRVPTTEEIESLLKDLERKSK